MFTEEQLENTKMHKEENSHLHILTIQIKDTPNLLYVSVNLFSFGSQIIPLGNFLLSFNSIL